MDKQDVVEIVGALEIQLDDKSKIRFYQYEPPTEVEIAEVIHGRRVTWVRGCRWGLKPAYEIAVKHELYIGTDWDPWRSYNETGSLQSPGLKPHPEEIHFGKCRDERGVLLPEYRQKYKL